MRLAVISDVHGNLPALEAVLKAIHAHGVDLTVNLGDCVTSPLWPRETWELLESTRMATVRGNHDRWVAEDPPPHATPSMTFTRNALTADHRRLLGALPPVIRVDADILAVHGTPELDTEYLLEDNVDGRLALVDCATLARRLQNTAAQLVLCGHSHHQHLAATADGRLVLNPGSVGCPRSVDNSRPERVEADAALGRFAIATRRQGRWSFELCAIPYNWQAVIERAVQNDRRDWAAHLTHI